MKKKLTMCLSVALIAVMVICGTLAYLTSEDSDVNVMTLGNVEIKQHEYQRAEDENGNYITDTIDDRKSYVLEAFEQAKPLMPAIIPNGGTVDGVTWDYDSIPVRMSQVNSHGGASIFNTPNAQDKFVTVENTGKSDAYVRTLVAFEVGTATIEDDVNYPNEPLISSEIRAEIAEKNKEGAQPWTYGFSDYVKIDENNYLVYELVYTGAKTSSGWKHANGVLPAGETTYPNLCQVYLASRATNEDVEKLDGNKNGAYDILVLSQAVQVEGFDNAQTALDTAFGKASEKVAEWFGNMEKPEVVDSGDELVEALENGKDPILTDDITVKAELSNGYGITALKVKAGQTIDGGNNELAVEGAVTTWDSAISATGGTIKNLTITKGFRGVFINHNKSAEECGEVILKNVTIDGPTYTISCDQGTNNGLTAINSTFNGWTSYAATTGDVKFVDCSFGKGAGYAFCRPYAPTEFVGCEFEAGYKIDARAAVTFENCTLDGVALTADNLATLVTSNIANATVK